MVIFFYCDSINNMSEASHASSNSRDGKSPTQYDEDELNSLTILELKKNCQAAGIDIKGITTKPIIIARMMGLPNPPESSSARAASPSKRSSARAASSSKASSARAAASERAASPSSARAASPSKRSSARSKSPDRSASPHHTVTAASKKGPMPKAKGGDDPESELQALRARLKSEWEDKPEIERRPWKNLGTLKIIFLTKMMPKKIVRSSELTLVILVGPAAAGKSSALKMVDLGLTDNNTVEVDPDRMYEWFAGKYGYFPPDIKEDPTQKKGESDAEYKKRCDKNRDKLKEQNAARLTWWLANKDTFDQLYGREFENDAVDRRDFQAAEFCTPKTSGVLGQYNVVLPSMENMIFEEATKNGLNVLLDTTGGMKEPFLERMADRFSKAGYKVVVVVVVSSKADCKTRVSGPAGRNTQQHRKLDECIVEQIWDGFVRDGTTCRWDRFSREQGTEFAVVQNTGTQTNRVSARIIYRRNPDGTIMESVTKSVPPGELSEILKTYKVETEPKTGTFVCDGGGAAAGSASKGHGGSSRKRRISRRRIHGSRARKTIKKYTRPVTRRHRRHHRHI